MPVQKLIACVQPRLFGNSKRGKVLTLTPSEMQRAADRLMGRMVCLQHKAPTKDQLEHPDPAVRAKALELILGKVEKAWVDTQVLDPATGKVVDSGKPQKVMAELSLHGQNHWSKRVGEGIESGELKSVSLGAFHAVEKDEGTGLMTKASTDPVELSICRNGDIPGTSIYTYASSDGEEVDDIKLFRWQEGHSGVFTNASGDGEFDSSYYFEMPGSTVNKEEDNTMSTSTDNTNMGGQQPSGTPDNTNMGGQPPAGGQQAHEQQPAGGQQPLPSMEEMLSQMQQQADMMKKLEAQNKLLGAKFEEADTERKTMKRQRETEEVWSKYGSKIERAIKALESTIKGGDPKSEEVKDAKDLLADLKAAQKQPEILLDESARKSIIGTANTMSLIGTVASGDSTFFEDEETADDGNKRKKVKTEAKETGSGKGSMSSQEAGFMNQGKGPKSTEDKLREALANAKKYEEMAKKMAGQMAAHEHKGGLPSQEWRNKLRRAGGWVPDDNGAEDDGEVVPPKGQSGERESEPKDDKVKVVVDPLALFAQAHAAHRGLQDKLEPGAAELGMVTMASDDAEQFAANNPVSLSQHLANMYYTKRKAGAVSGMCSKDELTWHKKAHHLRSDVLSGGNMTIQTIANEFGETPFE